MRKKNRRLNPNEGGKNVLYLVGTILGISVIAFIITFVSYNNNNKSIKQEQISDIVANTINNEFSEPASMQIGKNIEEVKNEAEEAEKQINVVTVFEDDKEENADNNINTSLSEDIRVDVEKNETNNTEQTVSNVEEPKKMEFIFPVNGNIIKEFAKDSLVYSDTLKEWTTHLGIDIEAEKTTVVKAAEDGEIIGIKNDPRYGITVMIKHDNDFETRYANLLTAEYVKEGEMVVKGQTIGTIGNSATFEILDPFHLHFEILKNGEYLNPEIYLTK